MNAVSGEVVDAALAVHRELGPGVLETVYRMCLSRELASRGLRVDVEQAIPVRYRGHVLDLAFRADLIVERSVLVELKAVEVVLPVHRAQILTYLRMAELPVGLLINFNVGLIREGITRFVR